MCRIVYIVLAIAALATAACSEPDSFKVIGTVDGGASINLRYLYYTDGAVHSGLTAATDGKFSFEGSAPDLSAVEVYDNDYRLLARFLAKNGDEVSLKINRANQYLNDAGGNEQNDALTKFFNANADSLAAGMASHNRRIAKYVGDNPQSVVSLMLIAGEYDASTPEGAAEADSLLRLLAPNAIRLDMAEPFSVLVARINDAAARGPIEKIAYLRRGMKPDTLDMTRYPLNLITLSDDTHHRDSVVNTLRQVAHLAEDIGILDLSLDADTVVWVRAIRRDSATWTQGWTPGSLAGRAGSALATPSLPFYIIADSSGRQVWRGVSGAQAVDQLKKLSR